MWISIRWTSANELRYARDFIMTPAGRYQDLAPHRELLSVFKTGNVLQEGWAYCMRTDDKRLFKLYFEKNATRPRPVGCATQYCV